MPAAIRIDIHVGGFRDSEETSADSRQRLKAIVEHLSQDVRRILMEETNVTADEDEGTLTEGDRVKVRVHEGLGPSWPEEVEEKTSQIAEGLDKHLEKLTSGTDSDTLGAADNYDDGSFHVYIAVDLR